MFRLEFVSFIWGNLWRTKLRTILTLIGVVIGTGAIMTMVSLGVGLQESVTQEFTEMADLQVLEVMPGYDLTEGQFFFGGGGQPDYPLDSRAIRDIRQIEGVEAVSPVIQVYMSSIEIRGQTFHVDLIGMDFLNLREFGIRLEDGREIERQPRGVLVGSKVHENLGQAKTLLERGSFQVTVTRFNEEGEESRNYRMTSSGTLEERGDSSDYSILIPLEVAEEMYSWSMNEEVNFSRDGYDRIQVKVATPQQVDQVTEELQSRGYFIFSLKQILDSMNTVFRILQILLGSIGAIALVVASLGIVNTMLMSIYERTREIGIMKVVGASLGDIRNIFILEALAIGLIGGIAGVIFGWLFGRVINMGANIYISSQGGDPVHLVSTPPGLIIFILVFAVVVGVLSGLYPALKAMKLSPLEAIRQD